MQIIQRLDDLVVVQHDSFVCLNQFMDSNPDIKFILNLPEPNMVVSINLLNTIRLIQSRFVVYATLDLFVNQKSFIHLHKIDTENGRYYLHLLTHCLGDSNVIEEAKIEQLSKLLFTSMECWRCKYNSNESIIKCAVNPNLVLNSQSRCGDYELAAHRKLGL
jgi:hypothetical protein